MDEETIVITNNNIIDALDKLANKLTFNEYIDRFAELILSPNLRLFHYTEFPYSVYKYLTSEQAKICLSPFKSFKVPKRPFNLTLNNFTVFEINVKDLKMMEKTQEMPNIEFTDWLTTFKPDFHPFKPLDSIYYWPLLIIIDYTYPDLELGYCLYQKL